MNTWYDDYLKKVEEGLKESLTKVEQNPILYRAVSHTLIGAGKRIRPIILLGFCEACGGDMEMAVPFACAVEMVHTYSLIHDDLPCMDNDVLRRGKPSAHVMFGEGIALLTGDLLLNMAFETMLSVAVSSADFAQRAIKAAFILAEHSGINGMIGGQASDLTLEGKKADLKSLQKMALGKTAALIEASAIMGCVLGDGNEKKVHAAQVFGETAGLAYQIVDDILDETAEESRLGKPIGSDRKKRKATYLTVLGVDQARCMVTELSKRAMDAIRVFHPNHGHLEELVKLLTQRDR